jgi:hypothetical protein
MAKVGEGCLFTHRITLSLRDSSQISTRAQAKCPRACGTLFVWAR